MGNPTATVLRFGNHGRRSGVRPTPFRREWSSLNPVMRPTPAAARNIITDRPRPDNVIIQVADARRSREKRISEQSSKDNQTGITLLDLAALVYSFMAAAFYPAITWLLMSS